MAGSLHPVVKASLVAPLVIVPISILMGGSGPHLVWKSEGAGALVFLYAAYGLAIAYASLLVVGLPAYFLAKWLDAVNYPAALIAAALTCMIAGAVPDRGYFNALASLILFAFGGPIAMVFIRIVGGESMMSSLRRLID